MKKSILTLGTALDKAQQRMIHGGSPRHCYTDADCLDPTEEDDGQGIWICEITSLPYGFCTLS